METTTLGTGQLIGTRHTQKTILGIGGSATNDAGNGMASALGFHFLDKDEKILLPTGANS